MRSGVRCEGVFLSSSSVPDLLSSVFTSLSLFSLGLYFSNSALISPWLHLSFLSPELSTFALKSHPNNVYLKLLPRKAVAELLDPGCWVMTAFKGD